MGEEKNECLVGAKIKQKGLHSEYSRNPNHRLKWRNRYSVVSRLSLVRKKQEEVDLTDDGWKKYSSSNS